ncbi:MAG: hypothetical protein ABIF71_01345 [Planctomycetota bacterium]
MVAAFLTDYREDVRRLSPGTQLYSGAGCEILRYNHLFNNGVDVADSFRALDGVTIEESGWRPGVTEAADAREVIMDERHPDAHTTRDKRVRRVATDSRWWKIAAHFGRQGHSGF